MATVAAVMIVKDEERFLAQCLDSIKDFVDSVILVDTGSTDRTMEIAEEYGCVIYEHPWQNDFSEARNFALGKVPEDIDYVFIIDADEKVDGNDKVEFFRAFGSGRDYIQMPVISYTPGGSGQHWSIRAWKNGIAHYEGAIHNQVMHDSGTDGLLCKVRIHHYGYDLSQEQMDRKWNRIIDITKKQLEEVPGDPIPTVNLLQVYRAQHRWQDMVDIIKSFDHSTHNDHTLVRMALDNVFALTFLGRLDEAYKLCMHFLKNRPDDIDALYSLGVILSSRGQHLESILFMNKYLETLAAAKQNPKVSTVTINAWGAMDGALLCIGRSLIAGMHHNQLSLSATEPSAVQEVSELPVC